MTRLNGEPSVRSIEVRDYLLQTFESEDANVFAYDDADADLRVGVIHAPEAPEEGLTTYATVNLNEAPNVINGESFPVELFGVVAGQSEAFAAALASVALNGFLGAAEMAPGLVLRRILANVAEGLPNALLTYPMDWATELGRINTGHGDVLGLQVIPISDAEVSYLEQNGFDALDDRFAEAEIDYPDLSRPSIF